MIVESELDCVAVIKLISGEEIVALLSTTDEKQVKVEYPFTLKYDLDKGGVVLLPFCLWTDEQIFTFQHNKTLFIVPCSNTIAERYLDLVDQMKHATEIKNTKELDEQLNKLESYLNGERTDEYVEPSIVVAGNNTKH